MDDIELKKYIWFSTALILFVMLLLHGRWFLALVVLIGSYLIWNIKILIS